MGGETVANIRIEPSKVIAAGKKVKSVSSEYTTELNKIYQITDELKQYWQGSAAGRFITDIESYKQKFMEFNKEGKDNKKNQDINGNKKSTARKKIEDAKNFNRSNK